MPSSQEIVAAHSPDSDDAYMFYGLATRKIRSSRVKFRHVLEDIESLNQRALEGRYDLTAISYHAYPYVADHYDLMASGSSVGDGYGPMVVATRPMKAERIKGRKIAVAGKLTTSFLALKLFEPDFEPVVTPFDRILEAVREGSADAGLIIHEAQLTYSRAGFHKVIDLGAWWKTRHKLPLPLGGNVLLRSLSAETKSECCRMMRESIEYALEHREEALAYAMQFARDLDARQAEKFVGMYVNHHTLDCGDQVPLAAQKLLDLGHEAGVIPGAWKSDLCGSHMRLVWFLVALCLAGAQEAVRPKDVRDIAKGGADSMGRLNELLKHPDLEVRLEAVKAIVNIGGPRTLEPLVAAIGDNDPEMQIRAADGLVNFYLPGYVRSGLTSSLRRMGSAVKARFAETNDQVIDAFIEPRPEVIRALGKLARGGASLEARANAARAVGILRGAAAAPDILEALRSKDSGVIYECLIAIQKIGDPALGPRIAFLLRDLDPRVQIAAIETTGLLRNREASGDLADVLRRSKDRKVRRAALGALAMIPDPANRGLFTASLNDKDEGMRAAAAEGLGRLKNPADAAAIEQAFGEETKTGPRLSLAFALVLAGKKDAAESSPLRLLVTTLNSGSHRGVASGFLIELARDAEIRASLYPAMLNGSRDEKIHLARVMARSGGADAAAHLEKLSRDADSEAAQEGMRALRSVRARH